MPHLVLRVCNIEQSAMPMLCAGCATFAARPPNEGFGNTKNMSDSKRTKIHARISDTKLLVALGALHALMQGITALRVVMEKEMQQHEVVWADIIEERVIAWTVGLLFIILIVKTTRRFLSENMPWKRIIGIHLVFAALTSFLWYHTFLWVSMFFCKGDKCDEDSEGMMFWFLLNFDKLFLIYLFTVSVTYTYFYVLRDGLHRVQRSHIETQLLQTRLQMLKSQLHPHFLFNTLNSISSLIDINTRKAQSMLADLGDLLRHVLDYQDAQIVPLREELELLGKYVEIEKTRFSDDLDIQWEVAPDALSAEVPPMLLQPLVENAVQHGFSRNHTNLRVRIQIYKEAERLIMIVEDDGQGLELPEGANVFASGTGLKNVHERLESLYGERYVFKVENKKPGVRNYIEIPARWAARE